MPSESEKIKPKKRKIQRLIVELTLVGVFAVAFVLIWDWMLPWVSGLFPSGSPLHTAIFAAAVTATFEITKALISMLNALDKQPTLRELVENDRTTMIHVSSRPCRSVQLALDVATEDIQSKLQTLMESSPKSYIASQSHHVVKVRLKYVATVTACVTIRK